MRNTVPIIALVAIVAIVGVLAATTFTNQSVGPNETVSLLNASGDMISVTNIAELQLIINQPANYTQHFKNIPPNSNANIIPKEDIKKAYEDIFSNFGLGNAKITVNVNDLIKIPNGASIYVVEVTIENDDYTQYFVFYQSAYVTPKLGDNGIDGALAEYDLYSPKPVDGQAQPKYSEEQIRELAKQEYANHTPNATGNEKYDIQLNNENNTPIYTVTIDNNNTLKYNGNTGELLSSTLTETDYESIARQVAQQRLKQENKDYSSNLSLGSANNSTDGDKILYTFEIVFTDSHGKQSVGHVTVDAKTKEVVDFVLNDPQIIEDAEEPGNTTTTTSEVEDNTPSHEDTLSHTQKSSSSQNSSSSRSSSQNDVESEDNYY
jgi:uncharacterized membrane protein YkoI